MSVGIDVGQGFRPLMVMALISTDSREIEVSVEVEDKSSAYDAKSGQLREGDFSSSPGKNPGHRRNSRYLVRNRHRLAR